MNQDGSSREFAPSSFGARALLCRMGGESYSRYCFAKKIGATLMHLGGESTLSRQKLRSNAGYKQLSSAEWVGGCRKLRVRIRPEECERSCAQTRDLLGA